MVGKLKAQGHSKLLFPTEERYTLSRPGLLQDFLESRSPPPLFSSLLKFSQRSVVKSGNVVRVDVKSSDCPVKLDPKATIL
jgi:hypothetical protein